MPAGKSFNAEVIKDDDTGGCGIKLPFNPKDVFGKVRVPVVATIRGHSYRTTTFLMCGTHFVPLAKVNREAAGVEPGQRVRVTLTLDDSPRTIDPPEDLISAMRRVRGARKAWDALSYTHQREHVEAIKSAKKPETRARRIDKAIQMLRDRAEKA